MDKNAKKQLAQEDLKTAVKNLREVDLISKDPITLPIYGGDSGKMGYHREAENALSDLYYQLRDSFKDRELLKKIVSKKNLSPEELKENIGAALRFSLGPELLPEKRYAQNFNIGRSRPVSTERFKPILESIPVDKNRRITIRDNGYGGLVYAAEKIPDESESFRYLSEALNKEAEAHYKLFPSLTPSYPYQKRIDQIAEKAFAPQELGYIRMKPTGHIDMISSGKKGIAEGVMPRLLLEAASRGQVPHSSNLLVPGQKFTERMARDFQKPEFMDMLKKFLDTGKAGKYWSTAAPLLKTAGKIGVPLAGAYSSYSEAREEGFPAPLAAAYAGAEELNPTPISGIDFYKGAEKAGEGRKKNIETNYMPEELEVENEALKNYENSPARKNRAFRRIKDILGSK